MNLLSRWFGAEDRVAIGEPRWVVLDVETTGLDIHHDELLAIAGVAVQLQDGTAPRIALHDSFEAVLKRDSASTEGAPWAFATSATGVRSGMRRTVM